MIYFSRLIIFIVLSIVLAGDADHLIFNRICINPNEGEMIEIYNPTDEIIDLSNYYLSDQNDYYMWVFDNSNLSNQDFLIKFPENTQIDPQNSLSNTTQTSAVFETYYGHQPDISIIDTEF